PAMGTPGPFLSWRPCTKGPARLFTSRRNGMMLRHGEKKGTPLSLPVLSSKAWRGQAAKIEEHPTLSFRVILHFHKPFHWPGRRSRVDNCPEPIEVASRQCSLDFDSAAVGCCRKHFNVGKCCVVSDGRFERGQVRFNCVHI